MSILSAIGNTPLIELTNLNNKKPDVKLFGKLEGSNPGGSVKDRAAYWMIKKAEESGELTKGKIILEPTSGNTGIALAMIGAAKGYRVKLCMPQCVSMERQQILKALNAEVELTPAKEGTDGSIRKAHELLEAEPDKYYMPNQFENKNNYLAHYETTGPELLSQTNGQIDVFVAGMGTTGTLMGVYKFFKEKKPQVRIVGIEPPKCHTIQGRSFCRHVQWGGGGGGPAYRQGDDFRHNRSAASRPRRPVSEHNAVHVRLRKMPAITNANRRRIVQRK